MYQKHHLSRLQKFSRLLIFTLLIVIIGSIISNILSSRHMSYDKNTIIPRSVIFGNPDKIGVKISPDGNNLSYIAPHNGVLNIFVAKNHDINKSLVITNDTHRGIRQYFWSYDNENIIYAQDNDGDENEQLFKVNIYSKEIVALTPKGVKASIVSVSKNFPNYIIIMLNERRKDLFDLYLLNVKTGSLNLFYENDRYVDIDIDEDYQLRFASIPTPEGGKMIDIFTAQIKNVETLISLLDHNAKIEEINDIKNSLQQTISKSFMKISAEDIYTTGIAGFTKNSDIVYLVDSRNLDKAALYEINIITGEKQLIFNNDSADIESVMQNPNTKHIEAVVWNYAREEMKFFDFKVEKLFTQIKNYVNGDVHIISRSLDDKIWIAAVTSDSAPTKYLKINTDLSKIDLLFDSQENLNKYQLAPMHSILIKARDGLNLVSYLTLPLNTKVSTVTNEHLIATQIKVDNPQPLILYVHGGPTARDEWGLDKTHQWLANRGYAVLSVNYRGSTGFGKNFINAGNGEWARKMHDDILDAAKWAIDNGITTEDNIGIMGGSYGGYEALVGLTFTPTFFKCAVDIVGPSNLITLLESIPDYWKPFIENLNRKTGGNTHTEAGRNELLQRSPITMVDNITRPLLIGHGANDPRVKKAESDQIVHSMESKNIPVIYALYADEGHGFARPENRMSFFALTEYFLHQYMGGNLEPITSNDFKNSSLEILSGLNEISNDIKSHLKK